MSEEATVKNTNSRWVMVGALIVAVVAGGIILFGLMGRFSQQPADGDNGAAPAAVIEGAEPFNGVTVVDPPRELHDFTLTNQNNEPTSLSDFKGRMALMLFGYTHCPDVCPLTLLEYKKIKTALGDKADQMVFVFISIDGARDTPAVMADYLSRFDPDFVGLTGDEATLTRIGTDYDLYFARRADSSGSTDNYQMDHTSNTFLVDKTGQLVALYDYGTAAALIADDIAKRMG
jgi:protein SCO1